MSWYECDIIVITRVRGAAVHFVSLSRLLRHSKII